MCLCTMKQHRVLYLSIVFCFFTGIKPFRQNDTSVFEFTSDLYNLTLEENSVGSKFARSENSTKIGVRLPEKHANCKFRVAEVLGEKSSLFKAHSRQVGDFAFLRIRYKGDNPLNRELKEFYDLLVKATCKRKDSSNLETTTKVHLRVVDRNDASPVFLVDDQGYEATVNDTIEPFSKILKVEASDADIGINSEIYFSMVNHSHEFVIDPITGWIKNLRSLKPGTYLLKVKSEDRPSRLFYFDENEIQSSWTADVVIKVKKTHQKLAQMDVETNKIFKKLMLFQRQLVAKVKLKNAPDGCQVGMEESQNGSGFEIEQEDNEWKIYARKGYHLKKETNITVIAGLEWNNEYEKSKNVSKTIPVKFIEERGIKCEESMVKLRVEEISPEGMVIGKVIASVSEKEDWSFIRYIIEEKKSAFNNQTDKFFPFSIGSKNGLITVEQTLNFHSEKFFQFNVRAELRGLEVSAICHVSIEVLDSNDHAPSWSVKWLRQPPIPISIEDERKIGKVLLKVDAQDRDEGDNGRVIYKISTKTKSPFRVDVNSGDIWIGEELSPKLNSWPVTVWAIDWGLPISRASALNLVFFRNNTKAPQKPKPVVILEQDNHHSPFFDSFPDFIEVSEDAPIGTIVAKIQAKDEDTGFNGLIRYIIKYSKSDEQEMLSINVTSGELRVETDLTKFMKPKKSINEATLLIRAVDAGFPKNKFVEKNLTLKIRDVNNHWPEFDQPSYELHVSEDVKIGTELLKITSTDLDGGLNGEVRYTVSSNTILNDDLEKIVEIDEKSGVIKLVKQLDREEEDVLRFVIMAMDEGAPPKKSFVNLTIFVNDVNDNAPKCVKPITKARIPEDYPHGAFLTCLAATDKDIGQNARLKWSFDSLQKNKFPFRIDHHTGCIFLHLLREPLDFNRISFFNLTVDVADCGEPSLSTSCEIHVELIEVVYNHLGMEFDDVAKEASVYENSPPGTEVIMVEAKELADEKRKINDVRYLIIDGPGRPFFTVDEKGVVRTTVSLDREFKSAYWLTIEARDGAINKDRQIGKWPNQRKAILHVFVRILDRNDHRPQPRQPIYFAKVKENSPANVVVVKVEATDADDIGNDITVPLQFRIEKGDPQSFFRIDLTTGYVTTSGSRRLDREKQAEHELWVTICDNGDGENQLCSQVVVVVEVEDENDNPPQFTQPIHHYNIRANYKGEICRIFGIDKDDGINAKLFYNISEGGENFTIDDNGVISTKYFLQNDESYALTIQASDHGNPPQYAATRVVVTAIGGKVRKIEENNAPVINGKKSDYVIPISDADQVGLTIGKMEATDKDGDDLWWSISNGNENMVFDIRRDNGQLLLAKKVDQLERGELKLNISVTDGMSWDHSIVTIQISRSIKKRPIFSASHYKTDISEKTAIGTQIYTLKAVGEDAGPGTKPLVFSEFSVEDISMEQKIRIEPSSGNVIVMEKLDFETTKQIRTTVQVRQAGLKNFATLIINIQDENDNAPKFTEHERTVFVDETDPIGTVIAKVTAFDADSGENGMISYSIVNGNEADMFKLDRVSGEVRLAKRIDREEHVESILKIRATDQAKYSLSDEMLIIIKNSNTTIDSKVKFDRKLHHVSVQESMLPGTTILVLEALHHGLITFSLLSPCPYFDLNPLSGSLILKKWLTRERTKKSVNCTITAQSSGGEKDTTLVVAKILRTNQHAPIFTKQVYSGKIRENSAVGQTVLLEDMSPLIVAAKDLDSGPNALIGYKIVPPENEYFVVDLISGIIRVRKPVDYEKMKELTFEVNAFDMGQPPKISLMPALVTISVIDENDEPPTFEKSTIKSKLKLPTVDGIEVAKQIANDIDTVGNVRYFIKDKETKQVFFINSTSGVVKVKKTEAIKEQEYKFSVYASDGIKSSSYELIVEVDNATNSIYNHFEFEKQVYAVEIVENTVYPFGEILLAVNVKWEHADVINLKYRIVNECDVFVIHPGTGVIIHTGKSVDRETSNLIKLIVEASIVGNSSITTQTIVEVHVKDLNDNLPIFMNLPYDVAVTLNTEVGNELIRIQATDSDEKENGTVHFLAPDLPDMFFLDKLGVIKLKKTLLAVEDYKFQIIAKDGGNLESKTMANIRVIDKNQPVFEKPEYKLEVRIEDLKQDTPFLTLQAKSNTKKSELTDGMIGYKMHSNIFGIDFETGEIKLLVNPKKLEQKTYRFTVEAVEVTRPKLTASTEVIIEVKTAVHEHGPIFSQEEYFLNVPETIAIGQRILNIKMVNEDEVSFSIQSEASGVAHQFFSINDDGEIKVMKSLDFEKQQNHVMFVVAMNRRQISEKVKVTVTVEDINDEPPFFQNIFSSAQLDDAANPGQFVAILSATDLDTVGSLPDPDQKLLYKIIDGDETLFDIDDKSGRITLARIIDEEDLISDVNKLLNISVTDGIFTTYAKLVIELKHSGRRQRPPKFEQSQYLASALENTPVNKSTLLVVTVKDGILPIRYSLGQPSISNNEKSAWPVRIDKSNGRIHVSRVLNYHRDKLYKIPLVAEDSVGRRAFATLTLSVIDINDKPPVFVASSYSCSISALSKEGDTVLMVSAVDDDEMDTIEYSMIEQSSNELFSIHPKHGTIMVTKILEQNAGQSFELAIKATDSANPPHHATTRVKINVAAEGIYVPRFSNSYYFFSIEENTKIGKIIGKVQQVEENIGEVRFSISEAALDLPFSVERSTGGILVKSALDRETKSQWKMAIRVDAAGGVHATTTVTVEILDVNDNAPSFQGDYDLLTISEDAPIGTSVAIFSATDRDEAPSGKLRFSLIDENNENKNDFHMDEDSGWLTVSSSLDREKWENYYFMARVTDEGGLNTDIKFKIVITDVNDSPPKFEKQKYVINLNPEAKTDQPENQTILNLTISDNDQSPNNRSKLFISKGNEEGIFDIASKIDGSYAIILKRFEMISTLDEEHFLELIAFDGRFAVTCEVMIKIRQKEDVKCPATRKIVNIKENSKKGTLVLEEAKTSISGIIYSFKEKADLPFIMNFRNGIVKVKDTIDREVQDYYEFVRVMATIKDKTVICEETIVVEVDDENDNRPILEKKIWNVTIKENLKTSENERKYLTRIRVSDKDGNSNNFKYRILNDHSKIFKIDEFGILTVVKTLDREKKAEYQLEVVVNDGRFEDKAIVNVLVADENDNPPVFEKQLYSMKVMESESIGYELVKIRADGGDFGETIQFSLKNSTKFNRFVKLNQLTGVMTLAKELDYEKEKKIELTVIAIDSGVPPLTAEAKVEILVLDENDNAPSFLQQFYKVQVKENTKSGEKIIKVEAKDDDSEHFGRVTYEIVDLEEVGKNPIFIINQDGWIILNGSVDYEKQKVHEFKVKAKDGGFPALSSEANVIVEITDENDNPPMFEECNMTAVIQEGVPIGHVVYQIILSDADKGEGNGEPFEIELKGDGFKQFKISKNMEVVTNSKFQHSKKNRFLLTVVAKDRGGRSTDCPLTIWVKEESRHAPTMKPIRIRVNTVQNEIKAGIIGKINAEDEDNGDLLQYNIVEGSVVGPLPTVDAPRPNSFTNRPHQFKIDSVNGFIWAEHSIPAGLHAFNVTVTDGKFKTISFVEVIVSSIDADVVEHAVAIRIREMSVEEFIEKYERKFRQVISHYLNVHEDSIQLISVQNYDLNEEKREKRENKRDVEILMTAQRGHRRGYLKPDHIYSRLKSDFQSIQDQSDGMRYQLITEMCTTGVCQRGECRERIELVENMWTKVITKDISFLSPYHVRWAQCQCPDGYGGRKCEVEMNECARSPCQKWEMCIPTTKVEHQTNYECVCPLGLTGEKCEKPSCNKDGKCLEEAELSVGGDGYFEMSLSNEVESRMELEVEIKTMSTNGVIMWAAANTDYHMLAISNGNVEYTWDAGSGVGLVKSKASISDGKWHRISVSRRQRRTRLVVDEFDVKESFSPVGGGIINLHQYSQKIIFGAKVEVSNDLINSTISNGISACFRTIAIDGRNVPKTRQGLRLFGAQPGCSALNSSPCSAMPCENEGTCIANGRSFTCLCKYRFSGLRCEIDTEPCASNPCPFGIQCIPFSNDYLCKCPNGFTGKRCESRERFDIEDTLDEFSISSCFKKETCGDGQCITIPRQNRQSTDFICNCTGGTLQSTPCNSNWTTFSNFLLKLEVIIFLIFLSFSILTALSICLYCRYRRQAADPKYGDHCEVPHMRNTRVLMPVAEPPPLPPRGFRTGDTFSTTTGMRPMVQVRPFSNAIAQVAQQRSAESRSPSFCGSSKENRRKNDNVDISTKNRIRKIDKKNEKNYRDDLTKLNLKEEVEVDDSEDWRITIDDNINAAIRNGIEGMLIVGETELTPVINDDDYMTMKPRKEQTFEKTVKEEPPKVPAHAVPPPSLLDNKNDMEKSCLYDDVNQDSLTIDVDESGIEEFRLHIS